ncbi:hypothetical protein ACTFBT_16260 [Streptomyces microflavus]|uniref:hypothetical protein n=1 Tax=Streptomyces TaxID=1883 RepID=UPI000515A412|nr:MULTISPECIES: hypothetical protein [Streptomyces]MDX2981240.1 hypothetical protein [Streptomyces sp. NRRL_B-2249]
MTTAPAPRPSPADLASRTRAARRQADLLAPAELGPKQRFRWAFTQGIRQSGMTPHSRLVALTVAAYGNAQQGRIQDKRQPGLDQLAADTGLAVAQVAVALRVLESRGWVSVTRPFTHDGRSLHTYVQPHIPRHAMDQLGAARTERTTTDA